MSKSCRRSGVSFYHGVPCSAGGRSFDLSARMQRRLTRLPTFYGMTADPL